MCACVSVWAIENLSANIRSTKSTFAQIWEVTYVQISKTIEIVRNQSFCLMVTSIGLGEICMRVPVRVCVCVNADDYDTATMVHRLKRKLIQTHKLG